MLHFQSHRVVCSQLCWRVAVINNISTVLRMSKLVWGGIMISGHKKKTVSFSRVVEVYSIPMSAEDIFARQSIRAEEKLLAYYDQTYFHLSGAVAPLKSECRGIKIVKYRPCGK